MNSAGITVGFIDGQVVVDHTTFDPANSHREVIANGMILTMVHEIKNVIKNYQRFTEQKSVQTNNEGEKNEFQS